MRRDGSLIESLQTDTQEKPLHCRYCGRRYARKYVDHNVFSTVYLELIVARDLVNRHEKSFHPLADKINPDLSENDVTVIVDC